MLTQAQGKRPLTVCYSSWLLTSGKYLLLIAFAVVWVTLSWSAFVDWKTNDNGLNGLAAVLLSVIALIGLVGCGSLHVIKAPAHAEAQLPTSTSVAVKASG